MNLIIGLLLALVCGRYEGGKDSKTYLRIMSDWKEKPYSWNLEALLH